MSDPTIRSTIRPGDIGEIIRLHGALYQQEYGWDEHFEAYVAEGLASFVLNRDHAHDRIWIAEMDDRIVGCIAIVRAAEREAQLRWFLVTPGARGHGLGRRLMAEALSFCRAQQYRTVFLWTVSSLTAAAHLYREFGFVVTQSKTHVVWGKSLTEERYDWNETTSGHGA